MGLVGKKNGLYGLAWAVLCVQSFSLNNKKTSPTIFQSWPIQQPPRPPIRPTRWTRHELTHPHLPFPPPIRRSPSSSPKPPPSERKEASSRSFRPPPPPIGRARNPNPAPASLRRRGGASAGGRARAPSLPSSLRAAGEAAHLDPPSPEAEDLGGEGRGGEPRGGGHGPAAPSSRPRRRAPGVPQVGVWPLLFFSSPPPPPSVRVLADLGARFCSMP
ncbi:hypothetical protein PVAP13_8NG063100 [Panicum virgatum]|uniref:Uncharacterized protein n=1 Tax=Panicum virgatum TaxID=38727 RepID=A0A8T0P2B4_PANVG|nr:hypothetical protein PVAP13_8NG063100 [Panicum virgatum]